MKNGRCPKCGSMEVYSGADIPLKSGPFAGNAIPINLFSMASLDNYVCIDCGLVESYISDSKKLKEIGREWDNVEPGTADKQ